jgi:GNAT superfamily N-acetyltransferase
MSEIRIVGLAEQPALLPVVGTWLWEEWAKRKGRTLEQVIGRLATLRATAGPEQCFVVLDGDTPAATASLVHHDLDPRPELTPWLAGVYVDLPFRGRGHAARLVRVVEAAATAGGVRRLWLHTEHAAGLYAGLGWIADGPEVDHGHAVTLMHRDLG